MNVRKQIIANSSYKKIEDSASKIRSPESSPSTNSPICRILHLQKIIGNQAVQRLIKSGAIQEKLKIIQPGDIYEQAADRVSGQVMQMTGITIQARPVLPFAKERLHHLEDTIQSTQPAFGDILMDQLAMNHPVRTEMLFRKPKPDKPPAQDTWYSKDNSPAWAKPLKDRLIYDKKSKKFTDKVVENRTYDRKTIESYRRQAEATINNYTKAISELEKINEQLKKGTKDKRSGIQIVQDVFKKILKVKAITSSLIGGETDVQRYDNFLSFCKTRIPSHTQNPFLVYPEWQHETVHQRQCNDLIAKGEKLIEETATKQQREEFGWEKRKKKEVKKYAADEFAKQTVFIEKDIEAYQESIAAIRTEIESLAEVMGNK